MDNSINFKGAIILKQPNSRIQRMIKPTLGSHFQILKDFVSQGDVLYIVRSGKDKAVADFLTHHRTPFAFYTDLSTKSGFDDEKPVEAKQILDNYTSTIITTVDKLKEHFGLNKREQVLPFSTKRKANPVQASLIALRLDIDKCKVIVRNGYSDVFEKGSKKLIARISAPGQYGISFAFRFTDKNTTIRYALRGEDKIVEYTNESGRAQFLKNYNKAVKANKTNAVL